MIANPQVFEDSHLPGKLKHRDGEVDALSAAFKPATFGNRAEDVLLSGPSGVGKTVLARHTLNRLDRHASVAHSHIQCLGMSTTGILREVLRGYPNSPSVHDNTPRERLEALARESISRPYVVVLDEADDVPEQDSLSVLTSLPYVSLVVICHDPENWLAAVDSDVRGRISAHVQPDRYTPRELADILEPRAREGLVADVVSRQQLEELADSVAGVARQAIQALRAAAELAGERGHDVILDEDIEDSFARSRRRIREANLASLPTHHQVLYELIRGEQTITANDLHELYDRMADRLYYDRPVSPITRRGRRNKLSKLIEYGLIVSSEESPNPTYSIVDKSLPSPLQIEFPTA